MGPQHHVLHGRLWPTANPLHLQMLGGISCICAGFTPMSYFWVRLALALVGKAGASACFAIVFVYTAEMFPTPIRNSAVGICSTVARIGALSAPAIANLDSIYAPLPFLN